MEQPSTRKEPSTNNPLNKAAGIITLSSITIQTQSHELRRISRQSQKGDKPNALRPADLNRPGASEKQRALKHQPNRNHKLELTTLSGKRTTLEIKPPFRVKEPQILSDLQNQTIATEAISITTRSLDKHKRRKQ
jgi:hypothetical protein